MHGDGHLHLHGDQLCVRSDVRGLPQPERRRILDNGQPQADRPAMEQYVACHPFPLPPDDHSPCHLLVSSCWFGLWNFCYNDGRCCCHLLDPGCDRHPLVLVGLQHARPQHGHGRPAPELLRAHDNGELEHEGAETERDDCHRRNERGRETGRGRKSCRMGRGCRRSSCFGTLEGLGGWE